jgi:hypothetical protein
MYSLLVDLSAMRFHSLPQIMQPAIGNDFQSQPSKYLLSLNASGAVRDR